MNKKIIFILFSIVFFGALVGLVAAFTIHRPTASTTSTNPVNNSGKRYSSASYAAMTRVERIDAANAIFTGMVKSISQSKWNQDSGEEWISDDTTPNSPGSFRIHTITIEVDQPFVDQIHLGKEVILTIFGNSPYDGFVDHGLQVGDRAFFFAWERNLAWKEGGSRKTLMMMSYPWDSYLLYQPDELYHTKKDNQPPVSLGDLIKEIAQRRDVLIRP